MPHLITITGPSQAGKSTAIELFTSLADGSFRPVSVPKFTTREPRSDDKPTEVMTVERLPDELDLVYQQYDSRYGLSSTSLLDMMRNGFTPILVLNDVRLISDVKGMFGSLTKSIFLFRKSPKADEFLADAAARGDEITDATQKRFKKAEAIYRIYIENIYLFDHVLLNAGDIETLDLQIREIVHSLTLESGARLR